MKFLLALFSSLLLASAHAEDGHQLWLRYSPNSEPARVTSHLDDSVAANAARELQKYWKGKPLKLKAGCREIAPDGFTVRNDTIKAQTSCGLLYGAFALLREQAVRGTSEDINLSESPKFAYRILNHWDNLDGSIERGYAGRSIFWASKLRPSKRDERIRQYARACASVGINGSVLNNVNASPKILTICYLDSVSHIARLLRQYGIKVYLSVNFASPKALGATETADPLDPNVIRWWNEKVKQIYRLIPDFGGFVVKANSEGQPGPFDYGRTHADGANMLARALQPYGGVVFWRSFVYGASHKGEDRVKQAVSEFRDLDGQFLPNVILQSKNGPLDFQPREPYAPIFDNMRATRQAVELQITQEYLGQDKHLVFLGPMWTEFFSFVAPDMLDAVAGVANVGDDANYCGHPFAQANWYAFGRLAWNPTLPAKQIAREWLLQTWTSNHEFVNPVLDIMMESREACVDYMEPLGLHHLMAFDHHYGPEPDGYKAEYPIEWCPVYYHKADSTGIGFDRSSTGSNATSQYREPYHSQYDNISTCPMEYLLWFHHVGWGYKFADGTTLWQQLCRHYNRGASEVEKWKTTWHAMRQYIDQERWLQTDTLIDEQAENAREWRNVCLRYFQSFSKMEIGNER